MYVGADHGSDFADRQRTVLPAGQAGLQPHTGGQGHQRAAEDAGRHDVTLHREGDVIVCCCISVKSRCNAYVY